LYFVSKKNSKFAADMQISDKMVNIVLALLAAGLLAACIASVMSAIK
jgi:hypothetical protein